MSLQIKPSYIIIIILFILLGISYLTRSEPTIVVKTEKEIVVQKYRDTVYRDIERIKWRTNTVYKVVADLDTIRDTVRLVTVQKETIVELVEITKDQDTTINRLLGMDSTNQEIITDKNTEIVKGKKRINKLKTALKVSFTVLGGFIVKEILRL